MVMVMMMMMMVVVDVLVALVAVVVAAVTVTVVANPSVASGCSYSVPQHPGPSWALSATVSVSVHPQLARPSFALLLETPPAHHPNAVLPRVCLNQPHAQRGVHNFPSLCALVEQKRRCSQSCLDEEPYRQMLGFPSSPVLSMSHFPVFSSSPSLCFLEGSFSLCWHVPRSPLQFDSLN